MFFFSSCIDFIMNIFIFLITKLFRACSQNGVFQILTDKPKEKRPLGRPRRRWENNSRIGINMRNWVDSTQDRYYLRAIVNAALNLRVP